ncbi:hypothetical protein [Nitrosospira briensis]|nr:hypothetical protein [Nitrosospira briensis]
MKKYARLSYSPGSVGTCILAALKSGTAGIATPEIAKIAVMLLFFFYPR